MHLPLNRTLICLLAIVVLAFGLRAGAVRWWDARLGDKQFEFGDSETYWLLAGTIANNQPYQYGSKAKVFRTPGYPAILSTLWWFNESPSPSMARWLNAGLGTIACVLLFFLARYLFNSWQAGLVAGLWCALYPGAIGMSVFVLSEVAFCPLAILHLLFWTKAIKADDSATIVFCSLNWRCLRWTRDSGST